MASDRHCVCGSQFHTDDHGDYTVSIHPAGALLADRRAAIVRLLETRDQHLPQPTRRGQPASGFVHDTLAPAVCPTCEGVDSTGCTGCGGRGSVETRRGRDPYAVDKVQPYGITYDRHEAIRERDRQIDRLEQQTAPPRTEGDLLAEANVRPEGWELARRAMYAAFDYRALDIALEQLRARHEAAYHVLHAVHVYGWQPCPGPATLAVAEAGLAFLDERMPDPVRAPDPEPAAARVVARVERAAGSRALEVRDSQIREAAERGLSVAAICAAFGLKKSKVYEVVAKGEAA